MEQIAFKTGEFDGPLDLLLYLIKSNKMNIYDIPIAEITSQYISYVEKMKELDLNFAGEFIIMASELLLIKSRMLLPIEKNEDGDAVDPRTELVEKLLEYQKYKELTEFLKDREDIGRFSYVKPREKIKGITLDNDDIEVSCEDLLLALSDIFNRIERMNPPKKSSFSGIVAREPVRVDDRMRTVGEYLIKCGGSAEFKSLFIQTCNTKPQIVATFVAVLELLKLNKITVKKVKDEMYIYPSESFYDAEGSIVNEEAEQYD